MSTSRMDKRVQCPFYHQDNVIKQRIICEGLIDKSCIALIYQAKQDYKIQLTAFCCKDYVNCEIYQMLMQKYEEDP